MLQGQDMLPLLLTLALLAWVTMGTRAHVCMCACVRVRVRVPCLRVMPETVSSEISLSLSISSTNRH